MLRILALFLVIAVASAHVCFIKPHQRGTADDSQPGSVDCFGHVAPCGGRSPDHPRVIYKAGETVTVTFNKNLNHYYPPNVGNFAIGLGSGDQPGNFTLLALVPDNNEEGPLDMTATITIPHTPMDEAVLRSVYNSNNPSVPTFYACADIKIVE